MQLLISVYVVHRCCQTVANSVSTEIASNEQHSGTLPIYTLFCRSIPHSTFELCFSLILTYPTKSTSGFGVNMIIPICRSALKECYCAGGPFVIDINTYGIHEKVDLVIQGFPPGS